MRRRRVLLFGEAVTLAHVVRLVSIGKALDPNSFDVHLACDPRYASAVGRVPFSSHSVTSMPPGEFQHAIATGSPIFSELRLESYIADELDLIKRLKPDVIVSDFRVSLGVSARVTGVPLVTLTNAYWSPYARIRHVIPEISLARTVGPVLGQILFDAFRMVGYAIHMIPVNRVRRRHGLGALPKDFRHALVDGDVTVYSDVPNVVPTEALPASHSFIGPVPWSPPGDYPEWWGAMTRELPTRPVIYVTVGSSGPPTVLSTVLESLESMEVTVVAATAGRAVTVSETKNSYVSAFVPGAEIARVARLVISNGGSPTTYQALSEGKPVIGIATNMDQFLNMAAVEDCGCGTLVRSQSVNVKSIRTVIEAVLSRGDLTANAVRLAGAIKEYDWSRRMAETIAGVAT